MASDTFFQAVQYGKKGVEAYTNIQKIPRTSFLLSSTDKHVDLKQTQNLTHINAITDFLKVLPDSHLRLFFATDNEYSQVSILGQLGDIVLLGGM